MQKPYNRSKVINNFSLTSFVLLFLSLFVFSGCQTGVSLPKLNTDTELAYDIKVQSISGQEDHEIYFTKTIIKTTDKADTKSTSTKTSNKKGRPDKVSLNAPVVKEGVFKVKRVTMNNSDGDKYSFYYRTYDLLGDIDPIDFALPPPEGALAEVIDEKGLPLEVVGVPKGTIFYIPRLSLPKKPVKVGDSWSDNYEWKTLDTAWPFGMHVTSTLKSVNSCGGQRCFIIDFEGKVYLPKKFPIKATLKSVVKGQIVYGDLSHRFMMGWAKTAEVFDIAKQVLDVETCVVSYSTEPKIESIIKAGRNLMKLCPVDVKGLVKKGLPVINKK